MILEDHVKADVRAFLASYSGKQWISYCSGMYPVADVLKVDTPVYINSLIEKSGWDKLSKFLLSSVQEERSIDYGMPYIDPEKD